MKRGHEEMNSMRCSHCKSPEAKYVTDSDPEDPFCGEACLEQYYNQERHLAHRLALDCQWGRIKLQSLINRFVATGVITKYLILYECLDVSDICLAIMKSFFIAEMVTIYMWPSSVVTSSGRFISVAHRDTLQIPKIQRLRHTINKSTAGTIIEACHPNTGPDTGNFLLCMDAQTHETQLVHQRMHQYVPLFCTLRYTTHLRLRGWTASPRMMLANVTPLILQRPDSVDTILFEEDTNKSMYVSIYFSKWAGLTRTHFDMSAVQVYCGIDGEPLDFSYGHAHNMVITKDGSLYIKGKNEMHQMGCETSSETFVRARIGDTPLLDATGGVYQTFSIGMNGDVFACGDNTFGELGLGSCNNCVKSHTRITGLPPMCRIVCGVRFTMAIDIYGRLWATGSNTKGQLGLGDTNTRYTFQKVPGIKGCVVAVTCGNNLTVITLSDYSRWVTGTNLAGQQGIDEEITHTTVFTRFNYLPTLRVK